MSTKQTKQVQDNLTPDFGIKNNENGYDPIEDFISNLESNLLNDLELDSNDLIRPYSQKGREIIELITNLNYGDPYYDTVFLIDIYGNSFWYSKMHEDKFMQDYYNYSLPKNGEFDYDYFYAIELGIEFEFANIEKNEIDQCSSFLDEGLCPYIDDDPEAFIPAPNPY